MKNFLCEDQYIFDYQRVINHLLAKVQISIFIECLTKRVCLSDHLCEVQDLSEYACVSHSFILFILPIAIFDFLVQSLLKKVSQFRSFKLYYHKESILFHLSNLKWLLLILSGISWIITFQHQTVIAAIKSKSWNYHHLIELFIEANQLSAIVSQSKISYSLFMWPFSKFLHLGYSRFLLMTQSECCIHHYL